MSRESRIVDQMDLLGIKDVSTPRQCKNGTVVWQLPIKINYPGNAERFIEVASFKTGYVRNQNCGYSNYQLNKRCDSEPQYYPDYKWCDKKNMSIKTGKFYKYTTRSCVLIPKEIDRLEYLIAYCLKNYYIKNANQVADGKYIEQWYHDRQLERANGTYSENTGAMARINDMEEKLDNMTKARDHCLNDIHNLEDRIYELKSQVDVADNKLSNAISPTKYESVKRELAATKVRQDVSVIVNGHRYKVL